MDSTIIYVLFFILTFNLFINIADKFDQVSASYTTIRKVQRSPMSIFTFLLDASFQNGYPLYRALLLRKMEEQMSFQKFKRRITEALVAPQMSTVLEWNRANGAE